MIGHDFLDASRRHYGYSASTIDAVQREDGRKKKCWSSHLPELGTKPFGIKKMEKHSQPATSKSGWNEFCDSAPEEKKELTKEAEKGNTGAVPSSKSQADANHGIFNISATRSSNCGRINNVSQQMSPVYIVNRKKKTAVFHQSRIVSRNKKNSDNCELIMTEDVDRLGKCFKRSLQTDFKANVLECRVCEEVFSVEGAKVPRLLQCGHTVCHSCLLRLQPSMLNQQYLLCPFDRQPTEIRENGVYGLKKNFALIELLERLEQSSSEKTLTLERERLQSTQSCDEDEDHLAVLYCTVCSSHLCEACDMITHSSKTLAKHRRVPLSEKPREKPKCPIHTTHIAEFTCIQEGCHNALMCYLCKDYGRHSVHKPALVEMEAESVRKSIVAALQKMTQFMESMRDTAHRIETVIQELEGWAIEDARHRVRQHFEELRVLLGEQEKAAMSCVDTETRGRLCALRQQQKDLTATRSQVAGVCIQCESILDSEDWKLLSSAEKVKEVLASLEQQQMHYAQLGPDFLTPESSIPIIFSRDNRVYIGTKIDMRVVILGLDGAGKTSILSAMRGMTLSGPPIPTIGFNVESLEYKNLMFTLWDVGGQHKFRPLWKHYYHNTQAVIFVVDASDRTRFEEAQKELSKIVNERELKDAWFLIYANKQDATDCASVEELTDILSLQKLCCGRAWHVQGSSPVTDPGGSTQGLDWLTQQLGAHEGLYSVSAPQ